MHDIRERGRDRISQGPVSYTHLGYAEHFQPLARDATTNATLRKMMDGRGAMDLELFWLSAADGQLRSDGVKRNWFIHRKPIPAIALDANPDLYRLFVDDETSTTFLPTELKLSLIHI